MNEARADSPGSWCSGWCPVRDASEAIVWRPVSHDGWTWRAGPKGWQRVEPLPRDAPQWAHRHGAVDAGALDVFEVPAKGSDVPPPAARPWGALPPLVAPRRADAPPASPAPAEAPAEAVEGGDAPVAAEAVEAPAVDLVAPLAPYVPPASIPLPSAASRTFPRRPPQAHHERRDDVGAVRRALADPEDVAARLGLCEGKQGNGKGATWVREAGGVKVLCPWHNERSPSCGVTRGPDGTVRVHCHACKRGGDVLHLVAAVRGVDLDARFRDVLAEAARMAGVDLDALDAAPLPPRRGAPRPLPVEGDVGDEFPAFAAALLAAAPLGADDAADVRAYLDGRGILAEALADGWGALPSTGEGLARLQRELVVAAGEAAWQASGVAREGGGWLYSSHRLVIPWRDTSGRVTWLQRRSLGGGGGPRYVARTGSGATAPYGAERLSASADGLVVAITEGAVDALALRAACSREGAGAVILGAPGTTWQPSWCPLLAGRDVALAADDDGAGDDFVARVAPDIQRVARSVQRWRPRGAKDWSEAWQRTTARG